MNTITVSVTDSKGEVKTLEVVRETRLSQVFEMLGLNLADDDANSGCGRGRAWVKCVLAGKR